MRSHQLGSQLGKVHLGVTFERGKRAGFLCKQQGERERESAGLVAKGRILALLYF